MTTDKVSFKNKYFALSMAIRSMSCQMLADLTDEQYKKYEHTWSELVHRKNILVHNLLENHPQNNHRWAKQLISEVSEEYKELESLSSTYTKEVHTGEWKSRDHSPTIKGAWSGLLSDSSPF